MRLNYVLRIKWQTSIKIEGYKLRKIISKHVKPVNQDSKLKLNIYYKNKKLKKILINNNICEKVEVNDSVVYKFTCNERGCNASYIGYTQYVTTAHKTTYL